MSAESDKELTPPSPEFLKNLMGSVKSFVKQKQQGQRFKQGVTIPAPRKVCPICLKMHDYGNRLPESELIKDYCPDCLKSLKDGYTACVCDNRYAFVKSSKLAGLEGQVLKLEKPTMDLLQKEFSGNVKERKEDDNTPEKS
jgi:hypothetical protein